MPDVTATQCNSRAALRCGVAAMLARAGGVSGYDQARRSMSAPPGQISGEQHAPQTDRRARREQARTGALVVLAILITLFAVLNFREVKVDWIFGSGHAPLIIVIVISLLVGVVLTHFAERRTAKRR